MTDPSDWQLLDAFAQNGDQAAFAQLVRRHLDLVYGTARRTLGPASPHLDDVVQAVFLLLSQKARRIRRQGTLAGWLFRTARFSCANVRKAERRRKNREREVSTMPNPAPSAPDLEPLLDDGLAALGDRERQAILTHYLQRHSVTQTANRLGISPDAAAKRLERGLQNLRAFFRRRGYVVPAVALTALLGAESAKAAPPALVARALAVQIATSTAAAAIARGTSIMMRWIQLKLLAAGISLVLLLGFVTALIAASFANPAPPVVSALGAVAGRRPMLVRWDLLIDDPATQRIIAALTPTQTASVGFAAYHGPVAKLRAALRAGPPPADPQTPGFGIFVLPYDLGWASMNNNLPGASSDFGLESHHISGSVSLDKARNLQAVINTAGSGPFHAKPIKDGIHLDLQGTSHEVTVLLNDGTPATNTPVRLAFTGDLPVGDALIFTGLRADHLGVKIWHLSVWEAFAASSEEFTYLRRAAVNPWITQGPTQPLADADQAIAWARRGKTDLDQVEPAFEKRLANGAIVRLASISRPAQWPDCWWDPAGQPLAWDPHWNWGTHHGTVTGAAPAQPLDIAITAEDPSINDPLSPSGDMVVITSRYAGPRRILDSSAAAEGQPLEVGVAAGPWNDGPKIALGQEVTLANVRLKLLTISQALPKNGASRGACWVAFESTRRSDVQIALIPFDKSGQEIPTRSRQPGEPLPPDILFDRPSADDGHLRPTQETIQATPDELATFLVRWRPRQWVTFTQFAANPLAQPGQATPLAAATTSAPAPAAGTPEAFARDLDAAAASGDPKKLRALMAPNTPLAAQYADMLADQITALHAVRRAAESKFGPADTATAMGELLPQTSNPLIAGWKVEGDRATPIYKQQNAVIVGPGTTLIRVNGTWKMEIALPEPLTDEMKTQFQAALPRQAAQSAAYRALAQDILANKYPDPYQARDALTKLRTGP